MTLEEEGLAQISRNCCVQVWEKGVVRQEIRSRTLEGGTVAMSPLIKK